VNPGITFKQKQSKRKDEPAGDAAGNSEKGKKQ
jgi:hypothetical protein